MHSKEEDLEKAPVLVQSNLATAAQDLASLLKDKAKYDKKLHKAFIIGGAGLYSAALRLTKESGAFADRVLLTRILSPEYECDVFMEDFTKDPTWTRASHEQLSEWVGFEVPRGIQEENGAKYEFQMWVRET
jgi:dihydrofolate reductase